MVEGRKRTLIHVGLPKTGTTSLQYALRQAPRVKYIHNPRQDLPQSRQFSNAVGVGRDALPEAERAGWRGTFVAALRDTELPVIISDETLSQVSRVDWPAFEEVLRQVDGEIHIVLVLRPFFAWLESLFNQFAKNGRAGILAFEADRDDRLNGYDIDFEYIHDCYSRLAETVGEHCRVHVMRYSRDINPEICAFAGISPDCLAAAPKLNPSPAAKDALLSFLKLNDLPSQTAEPLPGAMRFLDHATIDRLHQRHRFWMARLARRLDWPVEALDDHDTFRASASATSLLDSARDAASGDLRFRQRHEKESHMTDDTTTTNRKIKGDLARALLRMDLRTGRDGRIPEDDFKAAWAERREEMLDKAGTLRQTLGRMGYNLARSDPAETETETVPEA